MRRSSPRPNPAARRPGRLGVGGWLLLVLALPRVLRLFYPEIWVEDDFYLESAYLVSAGLRPYLDFVHPHMPVLEFAIAPFLRLLGANQFSIELLNEAAIYLTSALIVQIASRVAGRRTALCAALLYAFSSLVLRYHVFERECFAGALIAGAVLLVLDERALSRRRGALLVGLLVMACAIKLTAAISCAIVLGYLALVRKRTGAALAAGARLAAALGALSALFYWLYGFEFIFQTFLFHLLKGRDTTAHLAAYPGQILDLLVPLFLIGSVRIARERRFDGATMLVVGLVAANYLFFGWLSPTAWAHNYLDFLPYIAIVAGLGLDRLIGALAELIAGQSAARWGEWAWAVGGGLTVVVCLFTISPLINENWLRNSVYGFGMMPRDELGVLARSVREKSGPQQAVIAPSFICFEAGRRELVRYPETYGVYREARRRFDREGLRAARERLGNADFFALIAGTAHFWSDEIKRAVIDGSVNVVIADSPLQLLPLVRPPLAAVDAQFLIQQGFRPELRTEHFVVWRRAARQHSGSTIERSGD